MNPEAGPPYGLIEQAAKDNDLDELFELHRDSLRESVAATYGWDDNDQSQRFQAAWESRKSQLHGYECVRSTEPVELRSN